MSQSNEKSSKKKIYTYDFCGQKVEKKDSNLVEIIKNSNEYIYLNKTAKEQFINLNKSINIELSIELSINNLIILTNFKIIENPLDNQAKNKYIIKIINQKELTKDKLIISDIYFHNEVGYYINNDEWYRSELDLVETKKYNSLFFIDKNIPSEWSTFKKYLNIDQQIELLKKRNLEIKDENKFKYYLRNFSYHNFVNGYNDLLFKNEDRKTNEYKNYVSNYDLIGIFNIDRQFSNLILPNILEFERKISSYLIDLICNEASKLNSQKETFGCIFNWNEKIINKIFKKRNKKENFEKELLGHYKYKNGLCSNIRSKEILPIWVAGVHWTFGNIKCIISKLNDGYFKKFLSYLPKEFRNWKWQNFKKLFSSLNKIRNRCSHNNVIYNFESKNFLPNKFILNEIKNKTKTKKKLEFYSDFLNTNIKFIEIKNDQIRKIKIYDIVLLIDKLNSKSEKKYMLKTQIDKKMKKFLKNEKMNSEIINLFVDLINYKK